MKPNYKNWVPKGMIYGYALGTGLLAASYIGVRRPIKNLAKPIRITIRALLGGGALALGKVTSWCVLAHKRFDYNGKRQMSKQIVEGTADYVKLPDGGVGLDVGCGSGALTIACAKRNPNARFVGVDRWGVYMSFSKRLCERNARAERTYNVEFKKGNAVKLDYADETFDAVTSNYVYHNIVGVNKQDLLRETLRVLKKGGTFAIHDIMSKVRYGDMDRFIEELKEEGYEDVRLIPTDKGKFMSPLESIVFFLRGSAILVGKK